MSYVKLHSKAREDEFTNVVFFGANYLDSYPIKNLYKALNVFKPDALLVQMRPDLLLDNFKLESLRSGPDNVLDETRYLKQLQREGHELYPTEEYTGKVVDLLKKSGLLVAERTPERTSPAVRDRIRHFADYLGPAEKPSLRLSKEAFTTCGIWQHNNAPSDCQLYLADIPLGLHKFNILTSHHLQELEGLFADIVFDASSNFADYFEAALRVCPDVFLHHSDEYLAALVNSLS